MQTLQGKPERKLGILVAIIGSPDPTQFFSNPTPKNEENFQLFYHQPISNHKAKKSNMLL